MKKLLAIAILLAAVGFAQSNQFISILVQYYTDTQIDEGTGATNNTYTFVYQVPLPIGQSQNSKTYSGDNPPASLSVSNDIARDIPGLLSWMGATNFNVTVLMPEGIPQ